MTKTVCDFCGKEINPIRRAIKGEVTISKNGRIFDVCDDCKESLNEWVKARIGDTMPDDFERIFKEAET